MRLAAVSAAGVALFTWPFFAGSQAGPGPAVVVALAAVAGLMAIETGTRRLDARALALLATVSALDAALRLALVTGVGGFSPFFFPVLCAGFALGPEFGFLAGALGLLVSALATGGLGPWVPYQVFGAGWVGMAAGWAGLLRRGPAGWPDVLLLAAAGGVLGFLFGAAMDVWDWTAYYRGAPGYGWIPGSGPAASLAAFARFYLATSAAYDALRATGNVLLVVFLAAPVIAALRRVRARFDLEVVP